MFSGFTFPLTPSTQEQDGGNPLLFGAATMKHITHDDMAETLMTQPHHGLRVFVFYSDHCPACMQYKRNYAKQYYDKFPTVHFYNIDTANKNLTRTVKRMQIEAIPTFVFVKNGSIVQQLRGHNPQAMMQALTQHA